VSLHVWELVGAMAAGGVCPSMLLLGPVYVLEEAPFGCPTATVDGVDNASTFGGASVACCKD